MGSKEYEEVDSFWVENNYCIADELIESGKGKSGLRPCGSSDALGVYSNEDEDSGEFYTGYCRSCNQSFNKKEFHSSSLAEEYGIEPISGNIVTKRKFEKKPPRPKITKEETTEVLGYGYKGSNIRNIKDEFSKYFGQTTKCDKGGNPRVRFYPETRDGKLVGYKSRTFPKSFGYENKGLTGVKNDLAGQVKFKDLQFRDIVITGGEEDMVAFFQQYTEYTRKRNKDASSEFAPMPVVSPTVGEGSSLNQIRNQYDFINRAERIYIGYDNDEAGRKAAQEVAEIFPKEKVFIIHWSYNDPNGAIYNREGKDYSAQTVRDFYNAKPFYSNGILTSQEADELMEEELLRPKMSLPPFMKDLQDKMAGGIPLGYIVNWIAETGRVLAPLYRNIY